MDGSPRLDRRRDGQETNEKTIVDPSNQQTKRSVIGWTVAELSTGQQSGAYAGIILRTIHDSSRECAKRQASPFLHLPLPTFKARALK